MPTRAELQQNITRATIERAAAEHFASILRQNLAGWRKQETERHPVIAALLHGHNEAWTARLESLAVAIEQHATTLRTQETQLVQALAELPAEPAPVPPQPEASKPKRARKPR